MSSATLQNVGNLNGSVASNVQIAGELSSKQKLVGAINTPPLPSGTKYMTITQDGTYIENIKQYANVSVTVDGIPLGVSVVLDDDTVVNLWELEEVGVVTDSGTITVNGRQITAVQDEDENWHIVVWTTDPTPSPTVPTYDGPTTVTPSLQTQTLETAGKQLVSNITVNPIPSNYGLITYNGSVLTVS